MRIPFSLLFAIVLSLDAFAAPVPNVDVVNEFVRDYLRRGTQLANRHFQALEARKAKVAAKKAPVKAKAPGSSRPHTVKPPVI